MNNDGGPAFPSGYALPVPEEKGMSLRQWYLGQALIGLVIANENADSPLGWKAESVARAAGRYADALLAEDAKGRES